MQRLGVNLESLLSQEKPVYWQGRYWTSSEYQVFQAALRRSYQNWEKADAAFRRRRREKERDFPIRFIPTDER